MNECYLLPRDCDICGAEMYEGETAYFDESSRLYFCEECVECWAKAVECWAKSNLSEVIVGDDY